MTEEILSPELNYTRLEYGANSNTVQGSFVTIVFVIMVSSIGSNIFIIAYVCIPVSKLQKLPTVHKLIANLALTGAIAVIFGFFSSGAGVGLLDISGINCHVTSYLKHTANSAFGANIAALVWERIHTFKAHRRGELWSLPIIFGVWAVAAILNIPIIFTVASTQSVGISVHAGSCKQVPLFGSIVLTILHEALIFTVFDFGLVSILVYAIISLQQKVNNLLLISPVPSESLRRKIRSLRIVTLYLVIFTLILTPMCVMKSYGRIKARLPNRPETQRNNKTVWIGTCVGFLFLGITPFASLWLVSTRFAKQIKGFPITIRHVLSWNRTTRRQRISTYIETDSMGESRVEILENDEYSRFSTVQQSQGAWLTQLVLLGYGGDSQNVSLYQTTADVWV